MCDLFERFDVSWNGSLGPIDAMEHLIELTPDAKPVHQPPSRAGLATRAVIPHEIASMLEAGVVEPANTECASPVVFAVKKYASLRFCIDCRHFNPMTIHQAYPIPRRDDCLDSLGGATSFRDSIATEFTVNCRSPPGISTRRHLYRTKLFFRFTRMPFRLKNGPGTFQHSADILLSGEKGHE